MSDHNRDESLIDKVKNAFGMGSDDEHSHDEHAHGDHQHDEHAPGDHAHDESATERPDGWAGVDDALGGTENRPAGPDYAAQDAPAGIGDDSGGLGTAPLGGGTSDADRETGSGTSDWTRGETASGQSPFEEGTEADPSRRDPGV